MLTLGYQQTRPDERITPQEYLRRERAAEWTSEFIHGQVRPRQGRNRAHNDVTMEMAFVLHPQLRDADCDGFISQMRVKVSDAGDYVYPDFSAACRPRFEDAETDTLVNPCVLIEVFSPHDEVEHGDNPVEKWLIYQDIPTLQDFLLIWTHQPQVEWYSRLRDGWFYRKFADLDARLELSSINATLSLRDVYKRINFQPSGDNQ